MQNATTVNQQNIKAGWVFSPAVDLGVFWVPLIAAYFVQQLNLMEGLVFFMLMRLTIDMAHVLATVVPVRERVRRKKLNPVLLGAGILFMTVFVVAIYDYSKILFISILGTNAIVHVCRQQYGMLMVSRRHAGEGSYRRRWDALMMLNLTAFPTLWWLSAQSAIKKDYFFSNDLGYLVNYLPGDIMVAAFWLHWAYNIFYAALVAQSVFKGHKVNWPKIFLFLSTWVWFYGGILIFQSAVYFFFAGLAIHGLTYIAISVRGESETGQPTANIKHPFSYRRLFAIQLAAGLWAGAVYYLNMPLPNDTTHFLEPFLALPLIIHYCLDLFIWRRSMFA